MKMSRREAIGRSALGTLAMAALGSGVSRGVLAADTTQERGGEASIAAPQRKVATRVDGKLTRLQ